MAKKFKFKVRGNEVLTEEVSTFRANRQYKKTKHKVTGMPIKKDGKKFLPGEIIELTLQEALYLDGYVERLTEEEANEILSEI